MQPLQPLPGPFLCHWERGCFHGAPTTNKTPTKWEPQQMVVFLVVFMEPQQQMGMGQNETTRIWTAGFSPCFQSFPSNILSGGFEGFPLGILLVLGNSMSFPSAMEPWRELPRFKCKGLQKYGFPGSGMQETPNGTILVYECSFVGGKCSGLVSNIFRVLLFGQKPRCLLFSRIGVRFDFSATTIQQYGRVAQYGHGKQQIHHKGTARFSLPGLHVGYLFLTHSHLLMLKACKYDSNLPTATNQVHMQRHERPQMLPTFASPLIFQNSKITGSTLGGGVTIYIYIYIYRDHRLPVHVTPFVR